MCHSKFLRFNRFGVKFHIYSVACKLDIYQKGQTVITSDGSQCVAQDRAVLRMFHRITSGAHLNFSCEQDISGLSREIVLIIDEVLQGESNNNF